MWRHRPTVFGQILCLSACARGEPPTPLGAPSIATPATELQASSTATQQASPPPLSAPSGPTDPGLLPQTHDMPQASGAAFEARVAALWKAIVQDDPEVGMPFFFPLAAYEQVKDVANPAADWKHRLAAAYAHDIHALHARLTEGVDQAGQGERARLTALEVPESRARWVEPGEEYNKIGYFRVFGSRLRYEADAAHAFDVKSLISWRGQWYVVHLSAVK
jgi:hypothetical protein